jgi:hypothetical protein
MGKQLVNFITCGCQFNGHIAVGRGFRMSSFDGYISFRRRMLLAHGRWFFPGTLASSTTKTGRHDIAEILLKVALNTINQIKS